jgi:hypothetical protein
MMKNCFRAFEVSCFLYKDMRKDHPDWPEYEKDESKLLSLGLVGPLIGFDLGSFLTESDEYAGYPDEFAKERAVTAFIMLGRLQDTGPHPRIARLLEIG